MRQTLFRLTFKGICFGPPKTERSKRDIALPAPLVQELRRHRVEQNEARLLAGDHWNDSGLVFTLPDGWPLDPSVDGRRWHSLLAATGVAPIKLHAARHTMATILLLQGVDSRVVMDIMGWSEISTASNYQHAVVETKKDTAPRSALPSGADPAVRRFTGGTPRECCFLPGFGAQSGLSYM